MNNNLDITREALLHLRATYSVWLTLELTTDAERELAQMKIALIDRELEK